MFDLNKLIRANVKVLTPYSSARDEFDGEARIFLDANENPFGSVTDSIHNRYPDPLQKELKVKIAELQGVDDSSVFISNGSDESIDLIIRAFVEPNRDSILVAWPSYGMYEVSAAINAVSVKKVALTKDFQLDLATLFNTIDQSVRVVFLCNPNNPTGNAYDRMAIESLINHCQDKNIIVVIDEAYIDFCKDRSSLPLITSYPNLIILQTFSKAWGLAEARVGKAFASSQIVSVLTKIKAPYNVSGLSQQLVLDALNKEYKKNEYVQKIINERERFSRELKEIPEVKKVFLSDASYILASFNDPKRAYQKLLDAGVVVRDRSSVLLCEGCLRITIGTPEENNAILAILGNKESYLENSDRKVFKSIVNSELNIAPPQNQRVANVIRRTKETDISLSINLDGRGTGVISTGLGFFDHMLSQISKHAGFDLNISVKGDLHVDEHHTIEDTAIALGEAFSKALGDKRGIQRYAFILPMDEALSHVAIDISGRSFLIWKAEFKREKIGDLPTEMFSHFFRSFCDAARCNLSIQVEGENEHHKIEAIFKAFSRTLAEAVKRDALCNEIPSTKGVI